VDAQRSRLASTEQIRRWIADYGDDSDFVRVRVKGEFPRAATNQFIDSELVTAAQTRSPAGYGALVMGVDVARFGDDQTVFLVRRGDSIEHVERHRGLDTMQIAARVAEVITSRRPAAVFIDGVGVGGGVVDRLRQLGFVISDVNAGGRAADDRLYANRRAEMWGRTRDWLRSGGCLPPDDTALADDLIGPEYGFDAGNRILLERKEDMRRRGLASPDAGDALALTFADPVAADVADDRWLPSQTMQDWDPYRW
jgi:hypothetical protein